MASVSKREWSYKGETKVAWVVRYTDQAGKRRMKTFEKKKEADRFRTETETQVEKGQHTPDSNSATVRAVCEQFLRFKESVMREKGIVRTTFLHYRAAIDSHILPTLGAKRFNQLKWADIEAYQEAMRTKGLVPGSVRAYMATLAHIEGFAVKRGMTSKRIVQAVAAERKAPLSRTARIETFSAEQMRELVAALGVRPKYFHQRTICWLTCVVLLAGFCGLRRGEILGLTVGAIDFDKNLIQVYHSLTSFDELKSPKTASGVRNIPMPPQISMFLKQWLATYYVKNDRELLFRLQDGKFISTWNFHIQWKKLLARAGLHSGFHFHALRHFAASWMIENGIPLTDVAELLGHSSFDRTLQTYAHPVVGGFKRHAEFERMTSTLIAPAATRA